MQKTFRDRIVIDWLLAVTAWHVATREVLLIAAIAIGVSALDDMLIDAAYLARAAWLRLRGSSPTTETLAREPGWMAIVIPAWDEAAVIGAMLAHFIRRIDYPHYRVFVGVYPNDPATRAAVENVGDPRIATVVCSRPGPTTKADCLNHLWRAVIAHEAASGLGFAAVVLHDAEDIVDPRELRIFDGLIPGLAMVQLPVVPLVDRNSRWVSGHYLDEFAEAHGKDIVVRGSIGAAVPSAGVGCAIDRTMLGQIAGAGGEPFDAACMTEDYELGLRIAALGGRGALVRTGSRLVATREHFPATFDTAIRQKTRWLLGIALTGWDRIGWPGGWADRYMLLRDRKSVFTPILTAVGYFAAVMVAFDALGRATLALDLPPVVAAHSAFAALLWFNAGTFGWRLGVRAGFTGSIHGWREGLRAIPRTLIGNAINLVAAIKAIRRYRRIIAGREIAAWDKTAHRFPDLIE